MPYIPEKTEREKIDPHIKELLEILKSLNDLDHVREGEDFVNKTGGRLNYILCELTLEAFNAAETPKYFKMERITGTFFNAWAEIYRRVIGPYEDTAIKKNTDIGVFKRFGKWLKRNKTKLLQRHV